MAMRAAVFAFTLLAPLAASAQPPVLRDATVQLSGPSVRLSDLFAGVEHDRVIGPAPDPGGRIVVESAQLAAIARQFAVDWRPAGTGDRVVLERDGRPFPREPVMTALRDALLTAGISANSDIEMPGFNPPMVPPDDSARPDVTQLSYDASSGRFTALLSVTAAGMTPFNARLSGHVQDMVDVEVTTRKLAAGDVIRSGDVQPARVRAGLVRSEAALLPQQAVGMAARHPMNAGQPVLLAELGLPVMMQRGTPVQVQLDMPGLSVTVQGVAMEAAASGERVHVLNPASRAVMEAVVTGPEQVRVVGGTPALLPPGMGVPQRSPQRVAAR